MRVKTELKENLLRPRENDLVKTDMQSTFERREAKLDIQRRRVKWTEEKYREKHKGKSDKGREKDSYFLSSGDSENGARVPGAILRLRKKDSTRQRDTRTKSC